ncbi:MAG: DUF6089 family protein [Bacteroidales bacterium]
MKKIFIAIIAFTSFLPLRAQRNEIGLMLGTSYYLGDLNPSKQFLLTKPAGGVIYRYVINRRWAVKINGLFGSIAGNDAVSKFNEKRNLSFKSNIFEISSQVELNFLPYMTGNTEKDYFTPYIFAGISVFSFNPKADTNGVWFNLQPLGTEGQGTSMYSDRKPYSLMNVSFPFGLGFKYSVGKNVCIGAEWGLRKTTTDYMDDVSTTYADPVVLAAENTRIAEILADRSIINVGENVNNTGLQRGNSVTKDWYSFAVAFITVKFKTGGKGSCPAYNKHYNFKEYFKKD